MTFKIVLLPRRPASKYNDKYNCGQAFSLDVDEETGHPDSICHNLVNVKESQIYAARIRGEM